MARQLDAAGDVGSATGRKLFNQDAVRSVAAGLAGPQFAVARTERNARIRCGSGLDLRHLRSGDGVEELNAPAIEHRQNTLVGVEGEVHRATLDQGLLSPRPQKLVRRQ